jgi:predicted alpha/beta-fold hydrolase
MIVSSDFLPPWWLRNAHLQTLWPYLFRSRPFVATRRERLELPDGDFLDLDFTLNESGPVVLVLHGLEGSIRSKYAAGLLASLSAHGYRAVLMHFRGCSGEPNRLPQSYHSGETKDPAFVIDYRHGFRDSRWPRSVSHSAAMPCSNWWRNTARTESYRPRSQFQCRFY